MTPRPYSRLTPLRLAMILGVVVAGLTSSVMGATSITSLPYNIGSSGTASSPDTFIVAGNLGASGDGITFSGGVHDIVLDLGGYTINFGQGMNNNRSGVTLANGAYNIVVQNGTIRHDIPISSSVQGGRGVDVQASHHIRLFNLNIESRGNQQGTSGSLDGSHGIFGGARFYAIDIVACSLIHNGTGYNRRDSYPATNIRFSNGDDADLGPGATYHARICSSIVVNSPHSAIYLSGGIPAEGVYEIFDNYISTDGRNNINTGQPYWDTYHISCRQIDHVKIYNNTIQHGTNYGGGGGVFIERCQPGSSSDWNEIYNNTINASMGPGGGQTTGIRVRYSTIRTRIHHNDITVLADDDPATSYICDDAHGIWYGDNTGLSTQNQFELYNNHITAIGAPGSQAKALAWKATPFGEDIICRNNRITSNNRIVVWSDGSATSSDVLMVGDTLVRGPNPYSFSTYYLGTSGMSYNAEDNVVLDAVHLNGAAHDDVGLANQGLLDIGHKRTINVTVLGANNEPVPGAVVTIRNNYGRVVLSAATGASGSAIGVVTHRWESRSADSLNFNDFTIKAVRDNDSTTIQMTIDDASPNPTIILQNTNGAPDTIPPADVDDLSALPGLEDGTITLSWTAPGNDGADGFATSYSIKLSNSTFGESGWNSATTYGNPPQPVQGGMTQTTILAGLQPGSEYFIGVKAADGSGNVAGISNIASAVATLDLGTGGGGDGQVALLAPRNDSVVIMPAPTLVVANIDSEVSNLYFFEVARDRTFSTMVAASPGVAQEIGTTTRWQVDPELEGTGSFFWRVRANDNPYSQIWAFSIEAQPYVFPNPFQPASGYPATFTQVPPGTSLTLTTMSGNVVRQWTSTTGSDITWYGKNDAGGDVGSGTYLWYVKNPQVSGKLIVVR